MEIKKLMVEITNCQHICHDEQKASIFSSNVEKLGGFSWNNSNGKYFLSFVIDLDEYKIIYQ